MGSVEFGRHNRGKRRLVFTRWVRGNSRQRESICILRMCNYDRPTYFSYKNKHPYTHILSNNLGRKKVYDIWNEKWHNLFQSSRDGDLSWGRERNDQVSTASLRGSDISWVALYFEVIMTLYALYRGSYTCVEETSALILCKQFAMVHSIQLKLISSALRQPSRSEIDLAFA